MDALASDILAFGILGLVIFQICFFIWLAYRNGRWSKKRGNKMTPETEKENLKLLKGISEKLDQINKSIQHYASF